MKIQVTQENLNRALSSVGKVASSHSTLPILSNILIKTIGKRVSISATNLDIAITHYIGSKVTEEGSITVPSRLTQDFISSLSPGVINLELKDTKLNISTEKYKSTINGTSSEDYPDIPSITEGNKWKIPSVVLKTTLQQVLFSASNDESRPILTGVYFYTRDGFLYCAATDSYRLAEKRVMEMIDEVSLVIPASALQDLLRILNDSEDIVYIINDDQQILFEFNDVEMVARLIEGKYPDYTKLIPVEFSHSAVLLKSELTNTTKVASLFARENAGSVTVKLNPDEQTISVCSITSQVGENMSTTSAKVEGEGSITLNSRYIIDSLHALKGKNVKVSFNTKLEPCIITDPENDDYLHVIMPLKS